MATNCETCGAVFVSDGFTPGYAIMPDDSPLQMSCGKGRWDMLDATTLADARRMMHTAESCPDFQLYTEPRT